MNFVTWLLIIALVAIVLRAAWLRRRLESALDEAKDHASRNAMLSADLSEMSERLDRHATIFSHADLGILVLDSTGSVVQKNLAAQEFVGGRHGAALAESTIRQLAESAAAVGTQVSEEVEIRSPIPRTLLVTARPIEETDWAVVYVEDVTESRNVSAARTDFVANVSHELKTPLGALSVLADTLEGTSDPEVRDRLTRRIGEQAARMSQLVNDIMDLSLVEAATTEPAVVDLYKVLAAAAADVRDLAAAAEVDLQVEAGTEPLTVLGDERQLISATGNLLSNAVSYTAVAAPPRRVQGRAYRRNGSAAIEIVDTGIGIPASHQQRIFERFYRVDPARSRGTGGTGLGLAIVRHVALNHGGSVELESQSGVGSTFRMVIPADEGRPA